MNSGKGSGRTRTVWWAAGAAAVTAAVFLPALWFPFLPFWDDDIHVHANPHIVQLSWDSIGALWSGPWQQLYIPLTYSAWAGLAALSRMAAGWPPGSGPLDPAWFHGANIVLHAASAVLVFLLLRRVAGKFFPQSAPSRLDVAAALGACFFALHPLQTEPVAWVSGLRDVLGGCLGTAALVILFGADRPGAGRMAAASLLFLASLAAKPSGVFLPLAAAVLAVVPFRWPWPRIALVLAPWLAAGAAWVALTSNAQWAAELARDLVPWWTRPLVAGDALAFYTGKVFWPAELAADYGRAPDRMLSTGALWWSWLAPALLTAALVAVKSWRIYLVPWALFVLALLPTSGLVPFNFQVVSTVADRYAYAALAGPALALAMAVLQIARPAATIAAAAIVVALAAATSLRLPLWSEDVKLFAATLEVNPQSWKAKHNYASALDDRGRTAEAEQMMRGVIAARPDSAEAHNDHAVMLWKLGRRSEAAEQMRRSLALRPTVGSARNLAVMERELGNARAAEEADRIARELSEPAGR